MGTTYKVVMKMDSSHQAFKPDEWIVFQNLQASTELNG